MDPAQLQLTGSFWLDAAIGAAAAVAVALVVHAIAAAILARALARRPALSILLRHVRRPARWILVLIALQLVWQAIPDLPRRELFTHVTLLAVIAAVTWLVLGAINAVVEMILFLNPRDVEDNLQARRVATQARVLGRTLSVFAIIFGIAAALVTFPGVRQFGATLFASAGVAGLIAGFAARPVLGNLIAGIQIALTQPIRIDDVLIVEGEWGRVEEITGAFVVLKIWDERRLVIPLQWFIEHPFQNWTRTSAQIIGSVYLWVDYRMPVEPVRREFERLVREAPEWDQRVCVMQVTDFSDRAMQLRGLASAPDAGKAWDLRCRLREGIIAFVQREYPEHLPQLRASTEARIEGLEDLGVERAAQG